MLTAKSVRTLRSPAVPDVVRLSFAIVALVSAPVVPVAPLRETLIENSVRKLWVSSWRSRVSLVPAISGKYPATGCQALGAIGQEKRQNP
jgi:hypothetical protein